MPGFNQVHIDRALTNVSVAYMQGAEVFIADKVFPKIPVQKQSDTFFIYRKEDFFRDEAQERATGTESAGGDYNIDQAPPYFCRVYSFHKDVDERERANSDDPLNPDRDSTEFVSQKLLIKREILWASSFFREDIWGTTITGGTAASTGDNVMQWDNPLSTPVQDIRRLSTRMMENTGYRPNVLVLAPYVYNALLDHQDIIDRIKYTQKGITSEALLAELFQVDKVVVPYAIQNTEDMGKDGKFKFLVARDSALLCHTPSSPGLKKPAAGYIFTWVGLQGAGAYGNNIVRIPMPWLGMDTERIEGSMAFDMKVVSKDLGTYFKSLVKELPAII